MDAATAAIEFALSLKDQRDTVLFLEWWNEGEFDKLRRHWIVPVIPEAVFIGADPLHPLTRMQQPELTVWEGAMPESNGKSNFTVVLHRKESKELDIFTDGFQIYRSEYPDRAKYEADFMRWLIGARDTKPEIWDDCYDMDKHSGYVAHDLLPTTKE